MPDKISVVPAENNLREMYAKEAIAFADSERRQMVSLIRTNGAESCEVLNRRDSLKPMHNIVQGINIVAHSLPGVPKGLAEAPETIEVSRDQLLALYSEIGRLQALTSYCSGALVEAIQRAEWDEPEPEEEAARLAKQKAQAAAILGNPFVPCSET